MNLEETISLEEKFQLATYKKMPVVAERGEGVWIFTNDGERYLDLYGGHAVAGNRPCHPHVAETVCGKNQKLLFFFKPVFFGKRDRASEEKGALLPGSLS